MTHDIQFVNTSGKKYQLNLFSEVIISTSVENLVDTATIKLPETVLNSVLNLEDKLDRGTLATIKFGYDNQNETEFIGYITDITNKDGSLVINCEDALFVFRKSVPDKQFKPAKVEDVLNYLINQVDNSFKLVMDADFGITYEKFVIYQAEAFDVLKKIQEELKANIYFDTANKTLHFHAPYKEEQGKVIYDMAKNVEKSALEYKKSTSAKLQITIQSTDATGKIKEIKVGQEGGSSETVKVGSMSEEDMQKLGESMLQGKTSDRYEGSITTWLIPPVSPTFRAELRDDDYKDRNGFYYVTGVETSFSSAGGSRNVKLGIKLA